VIRFSAALVVAGLGLLLAGALTSELPLVYAAIVVCVIATILLATGVIVGRDEILGHDVKATGGTGETQRATAAPWLGTAAQASGPAALAPAASGPSGPSGPPLEEATPASSGLGWPAGKSPADALWARVDTELAAAGASVDTPKLTKDAPSEEIWGRVELELTTPAKWVSQAPALHQGGSAGTDRSASYEPIILKRKESKNKKMKKIKKKK